MLVEVGGGGFWWLIGGGEGKGGEGREGWSSGRIC